MENNDFSSALTMLLKRQPQKTSEILTVLQKAVSLRQNGEYQVENLKLKLKEAGRNTYLQVSDYQTIKKNLEEKMKPALGIQSQNQEVLSKTVSEGTSLIKATFDEAIAQVFASYQEKEKEAKRCYDEKAKAIREASSSSLKEKKENGLSIKTDCKIALKKEYIESYLKVVSPFLSDLKGLIEEKEYALSILQNKTCIDYLAHFKLRSALRKGFYKEGDVETLALDYQTQIDGLRSNGENLVTQLKDQIKKLKSNKDMDKPEKAKTYQYLLEQLDGAKIIERRNKAVIGDLVSEGCAYVNALSPIDYLKVACDNKLGIQKANAEYASKVKAAKEKQSANKAQDASLVGKEKQVAYKAIQNDYKADLQDARATKARAIEGYKRDTFAQFSKFNGFMINYRNGYPSLGQKTKQYFHQKAYTFKVSNFFLSNALYIILILAFLICGFMSRRMVLFSGGQILNILQFTATKLPLTLGAAGLILLGGTDLSVGRLVGMASIFSYMFMAMPNSSGIQFFGGVAQTMNWAPGAQIVMGLLMALVATMTFSALSGFLNSKLKINPFIATLATQLIVYGLMMSATGGTQNGVLNPAASKIISAWGTNSSIPFAVYIYAVILIFIAWFIWNKTTFGKNMYAVGGNPAAAAASGISVVKVTMGVFLLAGFFYGMGTFIEVGSFGGGGYAAYGQGRELEAIAAAVVGGISVTGGKGKISGAVIGTLLFQMIFVALQTLGVDSNLQFVMQGLVIIVAVSLDSLKYLKAR